MKASVQQRAAGLLLVAVVVFLLPSALRSQELEPRAYRPLPVGLHFGVLAYAFGTGNVVVDPSAPIEGLDLDVGILTAAYQATFPLFGRSSAASISLPYVVHSSGTGTRQGIVITDNTRRGPGDARLRLTHLVVGGPAQRPAEFAHEPHRRSVGLGLTVSAPTGNYRNDRLVNAGTNRWGFKPEIGTTIKRGQWINEIAAGVWLFTTNHDGPMGLDKTQAPLYSLQFHSSYNFDNGMWLAFDANFFTGGEVQVEGLEPINRQQNSRIGLTLSLPLGRKQSLKLAAHTGAIVRAGTDFQLGSVAYQRLLAVTGRPVTDEPGKD